ncbi:MAG: helix-turn-helix transcriptional regulator [Lachnospiraceae bacterium]|nr:helix-turn-helix transcriptional regulator [Lachnospiraceae bacterium]
MKVNYNKLWKMLIDLNMSKTQLRKRAGVTTNALAKMGKNENVSTEVLCKICNVLSCQIEDIMELVETENCESKEI